MELDKELGWVKIHRKLMKSQIWCNPNGLKVWIWILLRANHSEEPNWVAINTGTGNTTVRVWQGQFIYGRKAAAAELFMKESTVDYWVRKLASKEYNMIVRQATKHFTLLTVNNWKQYQVLPYNKPITSHRQANNTNKNGNNGDNVNNTQDLSTKASLDPIKQIKETVPVSLILEMDDTSIIDTSNFSNLLND